MYIVLADTYMDPENNSLQFILTHLLLMQSPLKLMLLVVTKLRLDCIMYIKPFKFMAN